MSVTFHPGADENCDGHVMFFGQGLACILSQKVNEWIYMPLPRRIRLPKDTRTCWFFLGAVVRWDLMDEGEIGLFIIAWCCRSRAR